MVAAMRVLMNTTSRKMALPQTAPVGRSEPHCRRCGAQLHRAQSLLDPRTGRTVRLFICACGEALWPDDLET
jgi:hypothetical protein